MLAGCCVLCHGRQVSCYRHSPGAETQNRLGRLLLSAGTISAAPSAGPISRPCTCRPSGCSAPPVLPVGHRHGQDRSRGPAGRAWWCLSCMSLLPQRGASTWQGKLQAAQRPTARQGGSDSSSCSDPTIGSRGRSASHTGGSLGLRASQAVGEMLLLLLRQGQS